MARPIDDNPADTRPGAVRDDPARVNDSTLGPNARTSVRDTELKRHRGGSTLWIILAVVLAILLALYLFSGAFDSDPAVGTDIDPATGGVVDGVVPEGVIIDGAPAPIDGAPATDGAVTGN